VSALDFLLKPIRYNKFMVAVEKAKEWFAKSESPMPQSSAITHQPSALFVRVDGELRNITINDIIYVNGMKDYVMFYLDGESKPLITHLTMKAVEEMLPPEKFLRVHRSYIIAVDKIRKVDRNDCIYIGNEIIHVPDGYQDAFHKFLGTRTINKM
jgi:DNA-binding LytR/AlgR family response regulator